MPIGMKGSLFMHAFIFTSFFTMLTLSFPVFSQIILIPDSPEGATSSPSKLIRPKLDSPVTQSLADEKIIIRIPNDGIDEKKSVAGVLTVDDEDKSPKIKIPSGPNFACECQFVSRSEIECPDGRSFVLSAGTNQTLKDIIREGQKETATRKKPAASRARDQ
jgi:hypothetical protein